MNKIHTKMEDKKYDELYERAQAFLNEQNKHSGVRSTDILGIMQELNIYRVELDMQNDELQKTLLELEESRDKFMNLYNWAPIAYLTIDKDDKIMEANTECIKLFDTKNALKGMILSKFITSKSQDIFYLHKQKLFETMKKQSCEVELNLPDGTLFNALLQSIAIQGNNKKYIHVVISDLTDIKN